LALVKNYVDLNNAEIKIKSKKGKGSIFTVIFNKKNHKK
jgi:signal transduction histidine kinase